MMETWYEVTSWTDSPRPVAVKTFDEDFVMLDCGTQVRRIGSHTEYYPTEFEAEEEILDRLRNNVDGAKVRLKEATDQFVVRRQQRGEIQC